MRLFTVNHLPLLKDRFLKKMQKSKNLSAFFLNIIGSNKSFTLIENNFRFLKIEKFEFKVTVHYGVWTKFTQLWPLNFWTKRMSKLTSQYPILGGLIPSEF